MKKFFTLVMAVLVVATMFAQQNGLKHLDNVKFTQSKVEFKRAERMEKLAALSRHAIAPSAASAKKSTQEDVVTLNFSTLDELKYQNKTQDWFMSMSCMDMDKPEFGYIVKFDYFAPADNYCGTFTTENFDREFSYMLTSDGQTVLYDSITLEVTRTFVSKNKAQVNLAATILGSNGVTYKINCVHDVIAPAEKVETTIQDVVLTYNALDWNFTLAGSNEVMNVNMLVRSNRVKGDHSNTVDRMNSHFVYNGDTLSIMTLLANIEAEEVNNVLSYVAYLNLVSTDTVQYNITMVSPLPAPTQTVDVVCENLAIDESLAPYYGYVYAEAKNDDYEILGMFPGMQAVAGTYTSDVEFYITNNATWDQVEALQYNLTLALDNAGKWMLTGTARCSDNVVYNLDLKWVAPEASQVVKISYETPATVFYTPEDNHKLEFMNDAGEWWSYLAVVGVKPGEAFGIDKVLLSECFLMNNYTWDMPQISDVKGVLEQSNDTTWIFASFTCFDGVQYDIEMFYTVPTPAQTVELTLNGQFNDQIASMGAFQVLAYTPDSTLGVSVAVYADKLEGVYGNDGLFGKLGAEDGMFDFMDSYTYVATYSTQYNGYELNYVLKGQVEVTKDANNIVAELDLICDNSVRYLLTILCPVGMDYDAQEGAVDRTYTSKDNVTIESQTDQYGAMIYFSAEAADASDMVAMLFFSDQADNVLTIPVGTYAINSTQQSGSVMANPGVQGSSVYPSYYATLSNGDLNTLYMLVDGSVEVSKNEGGKLHIEVNALNSYNIPVHIVYDDDTTTDVEDVQTASNVEKLLRDGQLVIIRDSKTYNAQGVEL